jgi:hypothetical protein
VVLQALVQEPVGLVEILYFQVLRRLAVVVGGARH